MMRKELSLSRGILRLAVLAVLLCFGAFSAGAAFAAEPTAGQAQPAAAADSQEDVAPVTERLEVEDEDGMLGAPEYEYQAAARPDPFKPFIAPKTVNPNELVDENMELTGMQLFEPGQLNLVAVMDTPRGRMAMVEDYTKKGYRITQGQLIGRRGQVTEIRKDEVVVTETAYTRGGEEIKTVVSMKMKRDGDSK